MQKKIVDSEFDLICIVPRENHGWILEKLAKVVMANYPGKSQLVSSIYRIPPARVYLFLHYEWLVKSLRHNPILFNAKIFAWYTHPKETKISEDEFRWVFNQQAYIISACQMFAQSLVRQGIAENRVSSVIGAGADSDLFLSTPRKSRCIGLVSAFYPRKNPELLMELVQRMPEYEFLLLGSGWPEYCHFKSLNDLENFTYIEDSYQNYPSQYRKMNVFLSLSKLEGGPVPLVEAMMANLIPVVSDTGFAREIIEHEVNGYLFPVTATAGQVESLIRRAFDNDIDVHSTAQHLTWDFYGRQMVEKLDDYGGHQKC